MRKILVRGRARGTVLKSQNSINFLGTVDKKTGVIGDSRHDLFGSSIGGVILAFPSGAGSSVGAYTIYSIKSHNSAPLAMLCTRADLTVATGCALADIPLIIIPEAEFSSIRSGQSMSVDTESPDVITMV